MEDDIKAFSSSSNGLLEEGYRRVYMNIPIPANEVNATDPSQEYSSNAVITGKYSLLTFIPKNLFEQFR